MPINEYDALASGETVAGNEYDAMAQESSQYKTQLVQSSMKAASLGPDADQQARVIELAKKTNLPTGVVQRNYDMVAKQAAFSGNEYDKIVSDTPGLAAWLEDPDNATVSKDDLEALGVIEKASKQNSYLVDLVDSIKYGSASMISGLAKSGALSGSAIPYEDPLNKYFPPKPEDEKKIPDFAYKNAATEYLDNVEKPPDLSVDILESMSNGEYKKAARALSLQVASNLPQLMAIVASRGTGLSTLFASSAGNKVAENLEAGVPQDTAILNAVSTAGVETLIESFGGVGGAPLKETIKNISKSVGQQSAKQLIKDSLKNIGKNVAEEGAEEFFTSVAQDLIDYGTDVNEDALKNIFPRAINAGIVGGASGGLIATAINTPAAAIENYKKQITSEIQKENYLDLGTAIEGSKLSKRSADLQGAYVEQVTKGGPAENIYISPDAFEAYFQKTETPASQVAEEMGIAREYNEAKETGADLKIKTSQWTKQFIGTEHYQGLSDDVKFSQDYQSVNESKATAQEVSRADVQAVESNQAAQESLKIIRQDMQDKLMNAGMKQAEARMNSLVWQEFFKAASEQAGISAEDLYKRYDVAVRDGQVQIAKPQMPNLQTMEIAAQLSQVDESGNLILNQDNLNALEARIKESDAGARSAKINDVGEIVGSFGTESTFPEFFKNKGYKKSDVLKIIEKHKAGKKLTEKQTDTLKDLYDSMADKINRGEMFQETRGSIQFLGNNKFNINLFKEHNESTFIHESSHFFLEVMGDLAGSETTSQQLKDDYAAILKTLGVESRQQIKTEQHEQFARSFEAYLMKGEAPSSTLRKVFNTFKVWLTNIYRQVRSLNVEISPELKSVFDRMLVAETETIAAQKSMNHSNLFIDPRQLGLSEEDTYKYMNALQAASEEAESQLRTKLMEDVLKKHTQEYREAKAAVTADVEQDLNNSKIYQAISILTKGMLMDGSALPAGSNVPTLSRESVVATYGEEFAKTLPRGIYAKDGGMHFDVAAEFLGFANGDSMLQQLANSIPKSQYIEQRVAREMYGRFPELMTSPTLPDEAIQAVHDEQRAKVLRLEAEMLAKIAPTLNKKVIKRMAMKLPSQAEMKLQAKTLIGTKTVKEIYGFRELSADPNLALAGGKQLTPSLIKVYQRAEAKAAKEAMDLLLKGDVEGALMAKRREMLNHELYKAAQEAKAVVEKNLQSFKKIYKKSDEALAKNRDVDIVNAAKAVLAEFGVGKKDKTADQYLAPIKAYDPDTYGTVKTLVDQAVVDAKLYKNVSFNQFVDLADTIDALWSLSKSTREIEIDGIKMDREQVKLELQNRLTEISVPGVKHKFLGSETTGEAIKTAFLSMKSALSRVEHWSLAVDSDKKEFTRYIWNPISEASNIYRSKKNDVIKRYRATFDLLNRESMKDVPIYAPELGPQPFKNKAELLGALLHTGNESNLQKLLRGRSWGAVDEDGTLNRQNWDKFIERMQKEGTLTKADYDWVQSVWNLLEELKPDAQKAHKQMYGFYFNEITAKEFETPFGTYRGGYVPAVADPTRSEAATIRTEKEQMERGQNSWMFPSTGRGFTKSRVEAYVAPLSLQVDLVGGHIDKVLRFTYIEPHVKAASRIVMDEGFRLTLAEFDPTAGQDMLVPWLQRAASQRTSNPSGNGKAWKVSDSVFNAIRLRAGMNIMTGNVINTLQNYTGIFVAASKVSPKYLRNATWDYISNSKEISKIAAEKSTYMDNELNTSISEAQKEIDQILVNPTKFETIKDFGLQHAYILQQMSQNQINTIVWTGAYNQFLEKGLSEKEAVREADSAVRTTQSSLKAEDVSRFETGTPFMRMFNQFYSYFNNLANLNVAEYRRIARDVGLRKGAGKLFYLFMMTTYLPATVSEILRLSMSGVGFDDDDDGSYLDDFMSTFVGGPARFMTAQVPVVGTVTGLVMNQFNDKHYDDKLAISPSITALESAVKAPGEVYDAMVHGKNAKGAVRDSLTAAALMSGLPLGIISRPVSYTMDVASGKAEPTGPIDFTRGFVTGKKGHD